MWHNSNGLLLSRLCANIVNMKKETRKKKIIHHDLGLNLLIDLVFVQLGPRKNTVRESHGKENFPNSHLNYLSLINFTYLENRHRLAIDYWQHENWFLFWLAFVYIVLNVMRCKLSEISDTIPLYSRSLSYNINSLLTKNATFNPSSIPLNLVQINMVLKHIHHN